MSRAHEFSVEVTAPVHVPREAASSMLLSSLTRISECPGSVSLTLHLDDMHVPVSAAVSVPVGIRVERETGKPLYITIEALQQSTIFPRFRGTVAVAATSATASVLQLNGEYSVPMGWIGKAVDSSLLRGAAIASLSEFLSRLSKDVDEAVRRDEIAHARAVLHQHV